MRVIRGCLNDLLFQVIHCSRLPACKLRRGLMKLSLITAAILFSGSVLVPGQTPASIPLVDLSRPVEPALFATNDARVEWVQGQGLRVTTGQRNQWPGVTFKAPGGRWDLGRFQYVAVSLKNVGAEQVTVSCRVDNPGADGSKNCVTGSLSLEPGGNGVLQVALISTPWRLSKPLELVGMRGFPTNREKVDPANITQILLFVARPQKPHTFVVSKIEAGGRVTVLDAERFLPFIDEFGQFIHADWPGKIRQLSDFASRRQAEEQELKARPGPADWNQYGGWKAGPQLAVTGFFRAEKYQGKWWLVDPEGRLFWSHGIDCVRMEAATPITDREKYFQFLPPVDSPLARFYGKGSWAPHGFYQKYASYKTYDFASANLMRKYGEDYAAQHAQISHQRLRSWGMNTIANWSDAAIYRLRKTPYTATLGGGGKRLEGSTGYWGKFYDVFDPGFREGLRRSFEREVRDAANDPWCIGFYVHNELAWGNDTSLAVAALLSPAGQPAKKVFLDDLRTKYGTVDKLNAAWGSSYESWESMLQSTNAPDVKKAGDDLRAFYTKTAETYFRTIREELKKLAPNQLYLGCRFAWINDLAARAAAKYCDVVSFNRYQYSVENQALPDRLDKPQIIGEFHFGALDRGMFHTGLKKTANQADRALKYKEYVQGALRNQWLVGTHWFQYRDQATTGRGDGENYQIGFVDIADTPYQEIVAASREVSYSLYRYRLGSKPVN